jgi:hypothetical protein
LATPNDYLDQYAAFEKQKNSERSSTRDLIKIDDDEKSHVLDNTENSYRSNEQSQVLESKDGEITFEHQ